MVLRKASLVTFFLLYFIDEIRTEIAARYEYKYSFKPPYLVQQNGEVPFWTYSGREYHTRSFYTYK